MPCSPKNDPLFACRCWRGGAPLKKACFLPRQKQRRWKEHELVHPRYHVRQPADIPKTLLYRTARRGLVDMRAEKQTRHAAERRTAAPVLIRPAQDGDKIGLAANIVSLRFSRPRNWTRRSIITAPTLYRALPCRNRPSPWSSTPRKVLAGRRRGSYAVGEGMAPARTGINTATS